VKVRYQLADEGGCGHYRLLWPGRHLHSLGEHDIQRATPNVDLDTDVVVIQRPLRGHWPQVIEQLHAHGIAVVVEIDDLFDQIDPQNAAWRYIHPTYSPDSNHRHLATAARMADLVTVSTPALQARYGGVILPNYVPETYLSLAPERPEGLIGWTGTPLTHPGDLDVARAGVQQALEQSPTWTFHAIGSASTLHALGVDGTHEPWQPDISGYAERYGRLSAAIVPLRRSPFNEAKSWLKGLEAAALGVPFVATPTGQYRQLHDLGAGLLADRSRDWIRELKRLLGPGSLREELIGRGLAVARDLTVERNSWRWAEAWALARANYEKRSAAA
jgi:glycosyltransferase involved in cell wall biosynthesis